MTIEQVLFFLLLLGIPLLERLVTVIRRRSAGAPPERPAPAAAEWIPAREPKVPADPVAQPIPVPVVVPGRRTRRDQPATARRAAQAPHRAPHPRRVALSGADLRVAVVHMAILGPCRALEPHDPSRVT